MDDPRRMDRFQRAEQSETQRQHRVRVERSGRLDRLEYRGPRDVLGRQPQMLVAKPAGSQNSGAEPPADPRSHIEFAHEPAPEKLVLGELIVQHLDRGQLPGHRAAQIHPAHAPGAEPSEQSVGADLYGVRGPQGVVRSGGCGHREPPGVPAP